METFSDTWWHSPLIFEAAPGVEDPYVVSLHILLETFEFLELRESISSTTISS